MLWDRALEALAQVHSAAPRSHLAPLLLCGLLLTVLGAAASGCLTRSRGAAALGALAGSALAVGISLTLFRGGFGPASLARLRTCVVTDPTALSPDGLANLALFAPAAFLAVLAIGRPLRVATGLAAVSLAIEGLQAIAWVGVCDSSDAVHNALGELLAALAATGLRVAFFRWRTIVSGSIPCPRSC